MNTQRDIPSVKTIINTDYWCMLAFLAPIIFAVIAGGLILSGNLDAGAAVSSMLISPVTDWDRDSIFLVVTALAIVLGPLWLVMRMRKIRQLFRDGVEAEGEVVFFRQFRDRGRIEFEFEHEGETVRAANPVHLSRAVRAIDLGQTVTAVYLPHNPKSAYIKEIFQ